MIALGLILLLAVPSMVGQDPNSQADPNLQAEEWGLQIEETLDRELAGELTKEFPELGGLLAGDPATQDQLAVHAGVIRILEKIQHDSPEAQAALLLAADRLAGHILIFSFQDDLAWEKRRKQLADLGLTFRWNELGAVWVYQQDLAWRVMRLTARD